MITKVMITTPSDTPIRPHHRRCARATSTWPLTRVAGLTCRCEIGLGLAEVAGAAGGLEVFPSRKASAAALVAPANWAYRHDREACVRAPARARHCDSCCSGPRRRLSARR